MSCRYGTTDVGKGGWRGNMEAARWSVSNITGGVDIIGVIAH